MASLAITSRGDDQAPRVLLDPTIQRMKAAGQDVTVYSAEKSPHRFYWARAVSAARALRGETPAEEAADERTARETVSPFFSRPFARRDAASTGPVGITAAPTWLRRTRGGR